MATPYNCSVTFDDSVKMGGSRRLNYRTLLDMEGDIADVVVTWYIGGEVAVRTAVITGVQSGTVLEVPAFTPTDEYNIKTEQDVIDRLGFGDHTVEVEAERV